MSDEPNAQESLELDEARWWARLFEGIPHFPRGNQPLLEFGAHWLMKRCQGCNINGRHWTPQAMAAHAIAKIIESTFHWERDGGFLKMGEIFSSLFPPSLPEESTRPAGEASYPMIATPQQIDRWYRKHNMLSNETPTKAALPAPARLVVEKKPKCVDCGGHGFRILEDGTAALCKCEAAGGRTPDLVRMFNEEREQKLRKSTDGSP